MWGVAPSRVPRESRPVGRAATTGSLTGPHLVARGKRVARSHRHPVHPTTKLVASRRPAAFMYISIAGCARVLTFYQVAVLAAWARVSRNWRASFGLPYSGERGLNRGTPCPNLRPRLASHRSCDGIPKVWIEEKRRRKSQMNEFPPRTTRTASARAVSAEDSRSNKVRTRLEWERATSNKVTWNNSMAVVCRLGKVVSRDR